MIFYPEQVSDYIETLMCAECEGYGEYSVGEYDNIDYYKCEHCDHGWLN